MSTIFPRRDGQDPEDLIHAFLLTLRSLILLPLWFRRLPREPEDFAGVGLDACGRALGLTAFLGSLAITCETEVIGLPQQTLACAVVVMAARTQLPQVVLASVIRGYI